jgi:hypothetical protein
MRTRASTKTVAYCLQFVAAMIGLMLAASLAGAQSRGGTFAGRAFSTPVRSAARVSRAPLGYLPAPPSVRHPNALGISPRRFPAYGFATFPNSNGFGTGIGVPGLGFDYPHLAAISGSLRTGARHGFGDQRRRGQGYFVPFFFGGFPYYYSDDSLDYDQPQPPDQSQLQEPVTQPTPAPEVQQAPQTADLGNGSSASLPPPAEPAQNTSEIVLIRKDGRMLFATAYSVVGTQLRYITPEGILRKFPLAELDTEATRQMNEARGNSVQFTN